MTLSFVAIGLDYTADISRRERVSFLVYGIDKPSTDFYVVNTWLGAPTVTVPGIDEVVGDSDAETVGK